MCGPLCHDPNTPLVISIHIASIATSRAPLGALVRRPLEGAFVALLAMLGCVLTFGACKPEVESHTLAPPECAPLASYTQAVITLHELRRANAAPFPDDQPCIDAQLSTDPVVRDAWQLAVEGDPGAMPTLRRAWRMREGSLMTVVLDLDASRSAGSAAPSLELAVHFAARAEYAIALEYIEEAAQRDPGDPWVALTHANILVMMGAPEAKADAILAAFLEAQDRGTWWPRIWLARVDVATANGVMRHAARSMAIAHLTARYEAEGRLSDAILLARLKAVRPDGWDEASAKLDTLLGATTTPNIALTHARAQLAWRMGHLDHAIALVDAALTLAPESTQLIAQAMSMRHDLGQQPHADLHRTALFEIAQRYVEAVPDDALGWRWLAEIRLRGGDALELEHAIYDLNEAIELRPNMASLHALQGDTLRLFGDPISAQEAYARADERLLEHATELGYATPWTTLAAHRLYRAGDTQGALDAVQRALDIQSNHPRANLLHGLVLEDQGDLQAAHTAYLVATHQAPAWVDPYLRRVEVARLADDTDGQTLGLEAVLTLAPERILERAQLVRHLQDTNPQDAQHVLLEPLQWSGANTVHMMAVVRDLERRDLTQTALLALQWGVDPWASQLVEARATRARLLRALNTPEGWLEAREQALEVARLSGRAAPLQEHAHDAYLVENMDELSSTLRLLAQEIQSMSVALDPDDATLRFLAQQSQDPALVDWSLCLASSRSPRHCALP